MTTQQVAKRFYELAQKAQWDQILNELYSNDARSIEPEGQGGLPNAVGLDKLREKARLWESSIEETHGGYCNEPSVAGKYFVCTMGADVTMKGTGRTKMDEVALYEVRDGKIVLEQFFY